jgi:hypothetical protein
MLRSDQHYGPHRRHYRGDDEDTIRTHYSRWVPERQARLTEILKEAFDDRPKPKLVVIRIRKGAPAKITLSRLWQDRPFMHQTGVR